MKKRSVAFADASVLGDYWLAAVCLLAGLLAVFVFVVGIPPDPVEPPKSSHDADVRALVGEEMIGLRQWQVTIAELCRDPVILALGLQPDCDSGSIELPNSDYFQERSTQLTEEGKQRLRHLTPALLARLRSSDDIWYQLSGIEIRGHADPQAVSNRYATNLVTSQARARAVLLFIASDAGIPEDDRADLQRLAVASGASDSRLPPECSRPTSDCYERARRVEIRLDIDDLTLRNQLSSFYDRVSRLVREVE